MIAFSPTLGNDAAAVVVGVSAGAVDALSAILPALPGDFPLPIMIVVHLPADKKSAISDLFHDKCQVVVKEAEDKEPIVSATVYFAPPDYHLLVEQDFSLSLSGEAAVQFSRPSIDVLFEAAADAYGKELIAVILTGASSDGAHGARTVHAVGGTVIVQSPEQAVASTMPRAALDACPEALVMTLEQIAGYLIDLRGLR